MVSKITTILNDPPIHATPWWSVVTTWNMDDGWDIVMWLDSQERNIVKYLLMASHKVNIGPIHDAVTNGDIRGVFNFTLGRDYGWLPFEKKGPRDSARSAIEVALADAGIVYPKQDIVHVRVASRYVRGMASIEI